MGLTNNYGNDIILLWTKLHMLSRGTIINFSILQCHLHKINFERKLVQLASQQRILNLIYNGTCNSLSCVMVDVLAQVLVLILILIPAISQLC